MNISNLPCPAQAKRDFLNALTCGPAGRVPYFEFSFSRQQMARLLGDAEVRTGWPAGSIPAMRTPPEWATRIARLLGIGFVAPGFIWELGRIYHTGEDGNDVYAGGSIRTASDLDAATRQPPTQLLDAALQRLEQYVSLARRNDLAVGFIVYGPLAIAQFAMGLDHFCISLYDDPDLVRRLIDAAISIYVPLIRQATKIGIDFLLISEALCYKSGPMFAPDVTRQLWRPAIEPYLRAAKADRAIPVGLHSDGNNTLFLPDFLELGFGFLHPIEPCDGAFDIYQTQHQVRGRIALAGNIDLAGVLVHGTPEEVRRDVIEHIRRLAPAGGYLCGSSHEINDAVPPENFQALVQTIHEFCEESSQTR